MKIKKINEDLELDVTIKTVRLPNENEIVGRRDECEFIDIHSFNYGGDEMYHAFFKEFNREEESIDDDFELVHGNEYDCNGVIDLIPIIEIEENLEIGAFYIAHNIPFIAVTENKLICLTRKNYYMVGPNPGFDGGLDIDEACEFIDEVFEEINNW